MLTDLFFLIVIISLLNATLITSFDQWGLFSWIHSRKPRWMKWYKHCYFCYGFQFALLEIVVFSFFSFTWPLVIVPFCCASLTFKIVSQ